jgi:hypothetical protein
MFATQWAVGEVFLLTIAFFLFLLWVWLFVRVCIAIFASHTMSGIAKALWVLGVLLFPFLGVLVYLVVHGGGTADGYFEPGYLTPSGPSDAAIDAQMRAAH